MTADEIGKAIRAFRSKACPACGSEKPHLHDTFCKPCTASLPDEMRVSLESRHTYLETFGPAMEFLEGLRPWTL